MKSQNEKQSFSHLRIITICFVIRLAALRYRLTHHRNTASATPRILVERRPPKIITDSATTLSKIPCRTPLFESPKAIFSVTIAFPHLIQDHYAKNHTTELQKHLIRDPNSSTLKTCAHDLMKPTSPLQDRIAIDCFGRLN